MVQWRRGRGRDRDGGPPDCASDYANEAEVGQGIAEAIKEFDIKREDIWWVHRGDLGFDGDLSRLGLAATQ